MYRSQLKGEKKLAVILLDEKFQGVITAGGNRSIFSTLQSKQLSGFKNVMVVTKASQLPELALFIHDMNKKNYLRGLFIRPDVKMELLPKLMHESSVTTLKHTLILESPHVLQRVLNAWGRRASDQLIADAAVADGRLYVISCSLRMYAIAFEELPALRRINIGMRCDFVIEEDGSFIHWPDYDIHLDLEMLEYHTNEEYRKKADLERLQYHKQLGRALKKLRESSGRRQSDIPGLSARQVRRIENGETPVTLQSLEKIARGLGMTVGQLMNYMAEKGRCDP
jgi:DNA-binding Xre family transcriptional regulator